MHPTNKFCVQWDDYEQNVKSSFKELREDREFADLTLVCQDGREFEVHKNILAFSSLFWTFCGRESTRTHFYI